MMNVAYVELEDLERSGRWGPPIGAEPVSSPSAPIFWHGDASDDTADGHLVKGLLSVPGIALLAGQSGAGKTFLAIDLMGAIATGEPFFGRKVKRIGGSLFLAAEAVGTIGERIDAMQEGREIEQEPLPIAWREVGGLANPGTFEALLADVAEIEREMQQRHGVPLVLIVLDTLAAAFGFEDENAAGEATRAMQGLQRLSAATGATVIAIAHYGKSADTGVRGSSAFTASADAILAALVERDTDGKVASRTLALTKSRRTETGWNCPFELRNVDKGHDEDGDPIGSCCIVPQLDQAQDSARQKAKGGLPKGARAYRDALGVALGDRAVSIRPFGTEGPQVWAVDRDHIRSEFYSRYPADGDEKQRAEVRRKAFNRGEADAIAARAVQIKEIDGVQLVWSLGS